MPLFALSTQTDAGDLRAFLQGDAALNAAVLASPLGETPPDLVLAHTEDSIKGAVVALREGHSAHLYGSESGVSAALIVWSEEPERVTAPADLGDLAHGFFPGYSLTEVQRSQVVPGSLVSPREDKKSADDPTAITPKKAALAAFLTEQKIIHVAENAEARAIEKDGALVAVAGTTAADDSLAVIELLTTEDEAQGEAVLRTLIGAHFEAKRGTVYLDYPATDATAAKLAKRLGFKPVASLVLLTLVRPESG